MKYRLVFTNIRTHVDLVGESEERLLIPFIMDMIGNGWMLSELEPIK